MIEIYSDGGSNPATNQAAGWALAIRPIKESDTQWNVFYGHCAPPSTNNIAELLGVINSLKILWKFSNEGQRRIPPAIIYSDSQYVIKSALEWRAKWEYQGMPPANTDLLLDLFKYHDFVSSICELELKWVKGHAGNEGNQIADDWTHHAKRDSNFIVENARLKTRKVVGSFNQYIGISEG